MLSCLIAHQIPAHPPACAATQYPSPLPHSEILESAVQQPRPTSRIPNSQPTKFSNHLPAANDNPPPEEA
jgi:hypothetical protein